MRPILATILLLATPAHSGEILQRMADEPPKFVLQSQLRPIDLEFCVGDVVSSFGAPAALRQTERRTLIVTSDMGKITVVVDMLRNGDVTTLTGYGNVSNNMVKVRDRVAACAASPRG